MHGVMLGKIDICIGTYDLLVFVLVVGLRIIRALAAIGTLKITKAIQGCMHGVMIGEKRYLYRYL